MSELNSLKARVSSNDVILSGISKKKQDPLTEKCEKVNGEIHDINCKMEKIEQDMESNTSTINSLYERLLALERYSRDFNLRFYKIPEHTFGTNDLLFLSALGLLKNYSRIPSSVIIHHDIK